MTNPVTEAMARAISDVMSDGINYTDGCGNYDWDAIHDAQARAALQAQKDNVSDEMIRSGVAVAQNCSLSGDYTWPVYIEDLICNVLDTAMKEETDE